MFTNDNQRIAQIDRIEAIALEVKAEEAKLAALVNRNPDASVAAASQAGVNTIEALGRERREIEASLWANRDKRLDSAAHEINAFIRNVDDHFGQLEKRRTDTDSVLEAEWEMSPNQLSRDNLIAHLDRRKLHRRINSSAVALIARIRRAPFVRESQGDTLRAVARDLVALKREAGIAQGFLDRLAEVV